MKKGLFKFGIMLLTFSLLTSCSSESYMDISAFSYLYTKNCGENLTVEDFILKTDNSEKIYCAFFPKENPTVLIKISADDNNIINSTEIFMSKTDENGNKITLTNENISLFIEKCKNCLMTYCFISENQAQNILEEMLLYSKSSYESTGELTKTFNNYHLVYYSAELSSEFIITNTYIKEIDQTNKPESRPLYGNTTNIRTETVPLQ